MPNVVGYKTVVRALKMAFEAGYTLLKAAGVEYPDFIMGRLVVRAIGAEAASHLVDGILGALLAEGHIQE